MTAPTPLATTAEVAAFLGVPVTTIHQWRHKGIGPRGIRVGRFVRFRWADVEAWVDARATERVG